MANKYSDTFDSSTVNYIKKNTNKDDLITVVGNHNIIYNFSERKSASKYSYQQPLIFMDDKMYKEYFKDIENNKPKIISQCLDLDQNSNFANDLNKFIEKNNYKLVFEGECDVYER